LVGEKKDNETKMSFLQDHEVWGCYGSENVSVGFVGCNAAWTCRKMPMFWRNILSLSLGLQPRRPISATKSSVS
jgi:hypothetical protein